MIPTILCVSIVVFTIMYFVPGDPARLLSPPTASEEEIDALRTEMGLNDPYIVRLGNYLYNTFIKLDLGQSYYTHQSVSDQIVKRLPYTLKITFLSVLISLVVGLPLGILAALNQNSWKDSLAMFTSLFCVSMPGFWFALILVMLFCQKLGWLPSRGISSWVCYILPCFSNGIGGAAGIARQTRSSMLETVRQDYVVMARAKGLRESNITLRHSLKNALIPIITVAGTSIGIQMGGALVAETIFSIPGIGIYMVDSIAKRDYPAIQGGVLVISICFCVVILLMDIVYAFVDPQIRSQYGKSKKS